MSKVGSPLGPPYSNLVTPDTQLAPGGTALLVIDVQNDFGSPGGAHPMPDLGTVVPEVVKAIEMFRRAGQPVVHVVRLYRADGVNADRCRRWQIRQHRLRVVVPDTWGAQLVPATHPTDVRLDGEALIQGEIQTLAENEFVCYKPRFNAFHDTGLDRFLAARGIDGVVIVGITFPNCVRATQLGATDLDYRVALVPSACTEVYTEGLRAMQGEGVQLMTPGDLCRLLGQDAVPTSPLSSPSENGPKASGAMSR